MFSLGTILSNSTQSKNLQVKGELLFFLGSCPLIFDHHKMRYIVCHQVRPRETANTPSFAMPPERPFLVCTETFCTWMILPSQVIHYKLREFSFRPTWEVKSLFIYKSLIIYKSSPWLSSFQTLIIPVLVCSVTICNLSKSWPGLNQ